MVEKLQNLKEPYVGDIDLMPADLRMKDDNTGSHNAPNSDDSANTSESSK